MNASTVVNDSPAGKERYYDEEAIELRDARVQFRSYREYLEVSYIETNHFVSLMLMIEYSYHHRFLDHT
jgi:hypothetical protein